MERTVSADALPAVADRKAALGVWSPVVEKYAKLAATAAQLALVLVAFHAFDIEQESGLLVITKLVFAGFVVHAVLPIRYRGPFFLALSAAGFFMILGTNSIFVFGAGILLIGVCHLPVSFRLRIGVLVALASAAAGLWATKPWSEAGPAIPRIVAVIASMFMFRLVVYMYDLRHERTPAAWWTRLSYFFLLPNVCFTLFPVVDYQTFRRTYHDGDDVRIYQKGVHWIFRGLTHLIAYRLVYYHLTPHPFKVEGLSAVILFLVTSWLLFLRVSGTYHVSIGILCLFGFNLPETNRLYFLAASPNEIWRRANIYWKDFMMKVIYHPSWKALNRRGWSIERSLIGATVVVFVATWILHPYQWFWLRGRFPLSWVDGAFWAIFASFVIANTVRELRRSGKRLFRGSESWSIRSAAAHTLKVMGMFTLMSLMWSWWNTRDTVEWFYIVKSIEESAPRTFVMLAGILLLILLGGVAIHYAVSRGWRFGFTTGDDSWLRSAAVTTCGVLFVLAVSQPKVSAHAGQRPAKLIESLQTARLNRLDTEVRNRSYYEGLMANERFTSQFDAAGNLRVPERNLRRSAASRKTGDYVSYELRPSLVSVQRGVVFSTNQWGMRDREYTLGKPPGTYRAALVGGSVVMGAGVEQDSSFEKLVEVRLNASKPSTDYSSYEILNFAMGGHGLVQTAAVVQKKVVNFRPDILILATLVPEGARTRDMIADVWLRGEKTPTAIQEILARAGVKRSSRRFTIQRRLSKEPYAGELRRWAYRQIVETCRINGIIPVWAYLPSVERTDLPSEYRPMAKDARAAGFVVLDLGDAYLNRPDSAILYIIKGDQHPNALGHRLLADRLYRAMLDSAQALKLADPRGHAAARK